MAEFGLVAPIGREGLQNLIRLVETSDARVPEEASACLQLLATQLKLLNSQILATDRRIRTSARATETGRRLMGIPGVGPLLASALVATVPDPKAFKSGRNLAAWVGLVPKQNSSGGKERMGGITKQGDRYLRQLLVVGALAVVRPTARRAPAMARAALVEARDQGCNGRACEQNCPDRLGHHDQRRELSRAHGSGSLIRRESAKRAWEGRKGTNASSRSNPEDEKTHLRHSASKRVLMVGTRLRGRHYGQRSRAPHQQVEHMAAPTTNSNF